MADGQNLLRPLRSDSLKPRPSTQAVWEPHKAVETQQPRVWDPPAAAKPAAEPAFKETVSQPEPEPAVVPETTPSKPESVREEPVIQPEPEPVLEEAIVQPAPQEPATEPVNQPGPEESSLPAAEEPEAEPADEETLPDPQTFLFQTFAPEVSGEPQPEPVYEEPVYEEPLLEETAVPAEEEEPFDLDAVIASILAEDDEESEDDPPAVQDALPSEAMPAPAFVPLYEEEVPKRKKKGWLWLVPVALIAGAAAAAWHFGWLDSILP